MFTSREGDTAKKYGRAIYIKGCMNIEISGNTYSEFAVDANGDLDITKAIVALEYRGLTGSDIGTAFPKDKITVVEESN